MCGKLSVNICCYSGIKISGKCLCPAFVFLFFSFFFSNPTLLILASFVCVDYFTDVFARVVHSAMVSTIFQPIRI